MLFRSWFNVHRLPDATGASVPANLLAGGLVGIGDVLGADDDGGLLARFGELRQVDFEGCVSANVFGNKLAVDPDFRFLQPSLRWKLSR